MPTRILVNDEPHELTTGDSVADLLEALALAPEAVAVEVNRRLVARARHRETTLAEGDRVEIVTLVGGG